MIDSPWSRVTWRTIEAKEASAAPAEAPARLPTSCIWVLTISIGAVVSVDTAPDTTAANTCVATESGPVDQRSRLITTIEL